MEIYETPVIREGKEIIYKGVRYVPDPVSPNKLSIFLMKDNHTFIRIYGSTAELILQEVQKTVLVHPDATLGTLFLLHDKREIQRFNFEVSDHIKEETDFLGVPKKSLKNVLAMKEVNALLYTNQYVPKPDDGLE